MKFWLSIAAIVLLMMTLELARYISTGVVAPGGELLLAIALVIVVVLKEEQNGNHNQD